MADHATQGAGIRTLPYAAALLTLQLSLHLSAPDGERTAQRARLSLPRETLRHLTCATGMAPALPRASAAPTQDERSCVSVAYPSFLLRY